MITSTAGGLRPPPQQRLNMTSDWLKAAEVATKMGITQAALNRMRYEGLLKEATHYKKKGPTGNAPFIYHVEEIRTLLDWLADDITNPTTPNEAYWANYWRRAQTVEKIYLKRERDRKAPPVEPAERLQGEMLQDARQASADLLEIERLGMTLAKHKQKTLELTRDIRAYLGAMICASEQLNDQILEAEKAA